jgi:hypothetical protein
MTITSNQVEAPLLDNPDVDQRPGSSDAAWAERAYRHQQRKPMNERRRAFRPLGRRWRILVATLAIVLLMAGLVVAMRSQDAAPSPVVPYSTSSQSATSQQPTTATSPFPLTPPLLRPIPSLLPRPTH